MNKNITTYVKKIKLYLCTILFFFLINSCVSDQNNRVTIKLDMSREHDSGRFNPDKGDKICIAGNFNNWEKGVLFLEDRNKDWIYTIELKNIIEISIISIDTLLFKFIQIPGKDQLVANLGWEDIEPRRYLLKELNKSNTTFIFNTEYDERLVADITFTVGMQTQKMLGFFKPEQGDQVVVSGDFIDWNPNGIIMLNSGDNIFSVTIPIKYYKVEPIQFKFRILTKRKQILPNKGWEVGNNRFFKISDVNTVIPYVNFNDIRRVGRFIINTKLWEEEKKYLPQKGDILQIRLLLDDREVLSDVLVRVDLHIYEVALAIPVNIKKIRWQIIKNLSIELSKMENIEIDLNGSIIRNL